MSRAVGNILQSREPWLFRLMWLHQRTMCASCEPLRAPNLVSTLYGQSKNGQARLSWRVGPVGEALLPFAALGTNRWRRSAPHCQVLQARFILSKRASKPVNRQIHKPKPPFPGRKLKTPSVAKRRFYMQSDGTIMRKRAGRRHYRSKKSKRRLRRLKGVVPLYKAYAKKLKMLGFKRRWWFVRK